MSVVYNGIKFHGVNDLSWWYYLEKAEPILDKFNEHKQYTDINEVIELFNIKQFFENELYLKSWDEERIREYKEKIAKFHAIIGRFFATINDSNFLKIEDSVGNIYCADFWALLEKYSCFERISEETILSLLRKNHIILAFF